MFDANAIKYKGLRITTTGHAERELMRYGIGLYEVLNILENGYDAPRKRAKNCIERWLHRKRKIYNVVIVKVFNESAGELRWLVVHVGRFSK